MADNSVTDEPGWEENPDWSEEEPAPLDTVGMLKVARARLRLTQQGAADLLGVPLGTVQNWEQRRYPPEGVAASLILLLYRHPAEVRDWLSEGVA
jgi:putative transcriptional regulator